MLRYCIKYSKLHKRITFIKSKHNRERKNTSKLERIVRRNFPRRKRKIFNTQNMERSEIWKSEVESAPEQDEQEQSKRIRWDCNRDASSLKRFWHWQYYGNNKCNISQWGYYRKSLVDPFSSRGLRSQLHRTISLIIKQKLSSEFWRIYKIRPEIG